MKAPYRALVVVCLLILASPAPAEPDPKAVMLSFYRSHTAVNYHFGACSRRRMDCSCFVQRLYRDHFELRLPRDTLKQVRSMRYLRVKTLKKPSQLTPDNLCVGDLIYTYRGPSWRRRPPTTPRLGATRRRRDEPFELGASVSVEGRFPAVGMLR